MTPHDLPQGLWRSPEELAQREEFVQIARHHEFPWKTSEQVEGMDRREFSRVMAAALAMAGMTACTRQPPEKIVPYVNQPAEITPGVPLYFATAMPFGGDALGLVVKSHMGHPIKVEGNPKHPASLGGTDYFAQASLLSLYDPDRSQTLNFQGVISNWVGFIDAMTAALQQQSLTRGARLRLLTQTMASPTLGRQIRLLLKRFPEARWHQWEAVSRDNARLGARLAFGQFVNTYYRFDRADVVLAVDADFLLCGPGNVRYARDFSSRRASRTPENMNRMYVVESTPSTTGAAADHRQPLKPSEMEPFLRAVAQGVGAPGGAPPRPEHAQWVSAIVKDLLGHRGASLVVAGDPQPPQLHALAHAINAALGNAGNTVVYTDPVEVDPVDQAGSLKELVGEMNAGKVDMLVMLGGNPVYDAPADLDFPHTLQKVKLKVHLSPYDDETSAGCDWHVPQTHFLEEWSDCAAFDGTASVIQPLIAPVYNGRSAHEVLSVLLGEPDASPHEIVRATWQERAGGGDFDEDWRRWLFDGVIANTALPPRQVNPTANLTAAPAQGGGSLEVIFRPDKTVWDGRFANNGYLQELPKPMSLVTWDAVALVSPNTARKIDTYGGGVVELELRGRKIEMPLWVQPGQADDCVSVTLGYGRSRAGRTGNCGFNAYPLRTADALWSAAGLAMKPAGRFYKIACTQNHFGMDGRYPVRMGSLEKFHADPDFAHKEPFEEAPRPSQSLYPEWRYNGHKWGMAIDLNACTGCNACVVACETENNIAIVGKEQVFRGRIMHWIRVDRYYEGAQQDPRMYVQPTPCMQCETAPCELVCPVDATVHSFEGINQMVYNRCVGTRYCSNNCPYKVRRFNFFLYSDWYTESLALMRNPEVTVRSRGVMEKCTYCIQRVEAGKIAAERDNNRPIKDGEIQTACQQACPTRAIIFGDLNDHNSQAYKLKRHSLNYGLLAELNTKPRTTYLARVVNLNPELKKELV